MTGLQRIIMHWTAGGRSASGLDKEHYHFIVQQDGAVVSGKFKPEDNISTGDGKYAAHTLNCNTGSIGVALCGMAGATERPFNAGLHPIRWPQIAVMCSLIAKLCHQYGIPVTRQTVLSHAEVQPTLGIKQKGKWDIAWLPGWTAPIDPGGVGDRLRHDILQAYNLQKGTPE
jgi:N-acetyl-anhydromuramyl-L-alanine amidase AmpD